MSDSSVVSSALWKKLLWKNDEWKKLVSVRPLWKKLEWKNEEWKKLEWKNDEWKKLEWKNEIASTDDPLVGEVGWKAAAGTLAAGRWKAPVARVVSAVKPVRVTDAGELATAAGAALRRPATTAIARA